MNIGLIGYGKMGREIENIAIQNGHVIKFKINSKNTNQLIAMQMKKIDVAIEFSTPNSAFSNVKFCLENNTPIVCGTTGWLEQINQIKALCAKKKGAFLYAENFSVGVNLFFQLNKSLSKLMHTRDYNIKLEEVHHKTKKDTPSGTAIKLKNDIKNHNPKIKSINIESKRIGNIKGEHLVQYESDDDIITIKHSANSRKGFAKGVILAAEFIKNNRGVFSIEDVLNKT